jgi:imidazolonepropionase-like amidohydrolase
VAAAALCTAQQRPSPTATVLKAGRLFEVRSGSYLANQGIWIDGDTIRQTGAFDAVRAAAPQDAAVIDLGNLAVLPGLIDVHAHLLSAMDPAVDPSDNLILTLAKQSATKRALLGARMARETLDGGFTSVRNVGHSGVDGDVSLRDGVAAGGTPGPRITAAARKIAPHGGQALPVAAAVFASFVDLDFLAASNPDDARRAVQENLRVGADVIKVVADAPPLGLDEPTMKAIVDEAHRASVKVAVHSTTRAGVQAAIAAGVDTIEHGDLATEEQFDAMRAKGIVFDPTLWPRDMLPVPREMRQLPNIERIIDDYLAGQKAKLDRARKAGVTIAFGSDMWFAYADRPRGEATRLILQALQTYGVPATAALKSATIDAAGLLKGGARVGVIEAGRYADIIAVNGDPAVDLAALRDMPFIMKGGAVIRHQR